MAARVTVLEAIRDLHGQLEEAAKEAVKRAEEAKKRGEPELVQLVAKSVEVELAITFSLEKEAGGGFRLFSLVDISGKAKASDQTTHKVKLVLEPVGSEGPVRVRDKSQKPPGG